MLVDEAGGTRAPSPESPDEADETAQPSNPFFGGHFFGHNRANPDFPLEPLQDYAELPESVHAQPWMKQLKRLHRGEQATRSTAGTYSLITIPVNLTPAGLCTRIHQRDEANGQSPP